MSYFLIPGFVSGICTSVPPYAKTLIKEILLPLDVIVLFCCFLLTGGCSSTTTESGTTQSGSSAGPSKNTSSRNPDERSTVPYNVIIPAVVAICIAVFAPAVLVPIIISTLCALARHYYGMYAVSIYAQLSGCT